MHEVDLVPAAEREETVERVMSVRREVPRCWAYTRKGEQCPHRGTPVNIGELGTAKQTQVALCAQHMALVTWSAATGD